MAIAVMAEVPGGDQEQDEAMQKEMGIFENPPPGALLRLAGPVEGGWRIISVWESREAVEEFRRTILEPALRRAGRPVPELQVWPLHSLRLTPAGLKASGVRP